MPRPRFAHRTGYDPKTAPFDSAEEAWFWCMRSLALRREGARLECGRNLLSRPCEPDDVTACLMALVRARRLNKGHVRVLAAYGAVQCPPGRNTPGQTGHAILWDEALDRMTGPLRLKGIVTMPEDTAMRPPPVSPSAVHLPPAARGPARGPAGAERGAAAGGAAHAG